jgi:hypothetical protein
MRGDGCLHREKDMVITLSPELEAALNERARQQGVAPEVLALNALGSVSWARPRCLSHKMSGSGACGA